MTGAVPTIDQSWLDRQRAATEGLPERTGASACIRYEVKVAKGTTVVFHTALVDGRIAANTMGEAGTAEGGDDADEPDFVIQVDGDVFAELASGRLETSVAFMQGRLRVVGNIGRMLSVLPVTTSPEWRAAMEEVSAG